MTKKLEKNFLIIFILSFLTVPTFLVKADLIGHYYWGYFYSTLESNRMIAEVDVTSHQWVRPVAQNSQRTKYGKFVSKGKGSTVTLARTKHGNRTYYNFK